MKKYNIPTASYETFDSFDLALDYIKNQKFPIVVKADGLALGKGVLICGSVKEAENAIKEIMIDKKFGDSGNKVVIEEFLTGHEVSVLSFCDGKTIVPMISAQDHKRALDGDKGLNTGGMGAVSPNPYYTKEAADYCMVNIFKPTVEALIKEGREFKGVIFFGLMITEKGPKVIEYNARFGDPEAQAVLPMLKNDLMDIFEACVDGNLDKINIEWKDKASCCVIAASGGYPEKYEKGFPIEGLDKLKNKEDVFVFQAGTSLSGNKVVTSGGRVLGITAIGENMNEAVKKSYNAMENISFNSVYYRKDIGKR